MSGNIAKLMMKELRDSFIEKGIEEIVRSGNLEDFLSFAREQAKKDGMEDTGIMDLFDELEKELLTEEYKLMNLVLDIVTNITGCQARGFEEDMSIIIQNELMTREECEEYCKTEQAKINIDKLNDALKPIDVKLEFVEAMNNPFKLEGLKNFVRFKVVELDS